MLAIVPLAVMFYFILSYLRKFNLGHIIFYSILTFLTYLNINQLTKYRILPQSFSNPNLSLVLNPKMSILKNINRKGIKLLSNNDSLVGSFKREYYSMGWYNDFILREYLYRQPVVFLQAFDYYLIHKANSLSKYITPDNYQKMTHILEFEKENEQYLLFKVKQNVRSSANFL